MKNSLFTKKRMILLSLVFMVALGGLIGYNVTGAQNTFEAKLENLGYTLPPIPKPVAAYVPAVKTGNLVYTAGQLPTKGGQLITGKVGSDLTIEDGAEAAEIAVLNALAAIKGVIGDLDNIKRIVKLNVFVNSAEGFTNQHKVANGASLLLQSIFGKEVGQHARAALGVNELPLNSALELELIVEVSNIE